MTPVNFLTATVLFILATLSQRAAAIDKLLLSQIVLAKVNYYRALSAAAPVVWKDVNSLVSGLEANNCSVTYDYWDDKGRIIFSIGRQDNQFPDTVNGSYFAIDHWWEQRKLYDPKSGEYDELQPFYDTWEYTQMVWSASTNIACSWGVSECDVPADQVVAGVTKYLQFVCNMEPAGNKWEQFYANVHCPDCTGVEPQTTTIDPSTISFEGEKKRAARSVATPPAKIFYSDEQIAELKAEVDRVEQYRYLSPEEVMGPDFIPGWSNAGINAMLAKEGIFADMDTTEMEDMVHSLRAKTLSRAADDPKQKRDAPPSGEAGKAWGNHYISTVNAWRKQHGIQQEVKFDIILEASLIGLSADLSAGHCRWPQRQDADATPGQTWRAAWWLADATTTDFSQQFHYALHLWEVFGDNPEGKFVGSLWTTFYDQLINPATTTFACVWTPQQCTESVGKPSYLLFCGAGGVYVPVRTSAHPTT